MPFDLGTIWASIGLNTQKLDAGLMAAQTKLATADNQIMTMGQRLTNNSTKFMMAGGLMVGAVAAIGVASVKTAAQFETSMRNVNSISNLSEAQFKKQADAVLTLSTKLPQSAKVLADGLYDIASSGFQGADGMKVLAASAKAASAGMTDTATSAKGVTAVLNAYGFEADKAAAVSDTMFKTVDKGVITFEELSSTVGDWIGMAKAANLSFEEASGAIAYMTTKGIGAAEAGVSLTRMLTGIIKPSEEMAAMIKNAGYESGEMMLKTLGLTGTMKVLNDATGGSITKLIELIPEIRGVRGANALLGAGYEELTDYMKDFNNTAGATDVALAEQSKSLEYQMKLLKNNANAVVIALGTELIPSITKYVTKLSEFIVTHKEGIIELAKFGGSAIGIIGGLVLLAGVIGKVRLGVLSLIGTLNKVRFYSLTNLFNAGAGAGLGTIAAVTAAVAALGYVTDLAGDKIDNLSDTKLNKLAATATRTVFSIGAVKNGIEENIAVVDALRKGYLTLDDAAHINIFTMDDYKAKIAEAKKEEEDLANGIYDSVEAFQSALTFVNKYSDEVPNATTAMTDLIDKLQNGELSTEAFTLAVEELRKETNNGRDDIEESLPVYDDFADKQDLARIKVEAHSQAQKNAKKPTEENTEAIDEQTESVDELRGAFEQLIGVLFDEIDVDNRLQEAKWKVADIQKELNQLVKDGKEGTREYEEKVNELDVANKEVINSLYGVYTNIEKTKEEQEAAKQEALKLALQFVETGDIGIAKFNEMAKEFGISFEGMSVSGAQGQAVISGSLEKIGASADDSSEDVKELQGNIDNLHDKEITITTNFTYKGEQWVEMGGAQRQAMGGIVGHAMGGIIGMNIPHAAGGIVIPQTGRAIPILAHEGEMILNSSQQGNLIDALWGVANGKGSGSGMTVNLTVISPEPLTPSEVARQTRNTLRLAGLEASL
jgi:TP901 family phage tail tape measure protein